jgi:hypothetical protein
MRLWFRVFHLDRPSGSLRAMTLQTIATVLIALAAAGALIAWRSAPAITVALLSGLVGAVATYRVAGIDGPEGVPAVVAWWFSVGLVVGAIFGATVTRRRERGERPLAGWAGAVLLAAPFACVALTFSLQDACPLYAGAGLCDFGGTDVLGGWITGVVFFFGIDLLVITTLLWFAPGRIRGRIVEDKGRARPQGVGRRGIVIASGMAVAIVILVMAFTRPSELEAWRSAQPDAESFAPNLLAPAPDPVQPVIGCPGFGRADGLFAGAFDPDLVQWLDRHVPRWLPADFGLVDWTISEEYWDHGAGETRQTRSEAVWADAGCRRVSLALFEANPNTPRLDRFYTVVDEVGDWAVMAGPGCERWAIADGSCLRYVAWSNEREESGGGVLGLHLQMLGIERGVGDRIALNIPVSVQQG